MSDPASPPRLPPRAKGKAPPPPRSKAGAPGPKAAPPQRGGGLISGPKLRPLFWTGLTKVSDDSVWADLVPPAPFDTAQLQRQFALADSRTPTPSRRGPEDGEAGKRLRVLDDRTSQNLAIAFRRLPAPERLAVMIDVVEGFPEDLPAEAVLALSTALSEQREAVEQIRQLAVSEADIAQLDLPERFLWVLGSVPYCAAKLACGALMVGSALELKDLRGAGVKVGTACQALRKSGLMRKCISTSLAVGNFLNRGTTRSGVRGVVLPESLVKLDELRGAQEGEATPPSGGGGGSVLDFVAQALIAEGARSTVDPGAALRQEAEELLGQARAAQSVSLDEAETSCRQVCDEAEKARSALAEARRCCRASGGAARMAEKVQCICDEAAFAQQIVADAKAELAKTQAWSSQKGPMKSNDLFASWTHFLELLLRAITRAALRPLPTLTSAQSTGRSTPSTTEGPLVVNQVSSTTEGPLVVNQVYASTVPARSLVPDAQAAIVIAPGEAQASKGLAAQVPVATARAVEPRSPPSRRRTSPSFPGEEMCIDVGRLLAQQSTVVAAVAQPKTASPKAQPRVPQAQPKVAAQSPPPKVGSQLWDVQTGAPPLASVQNHLEASESYFSPQARHPADYSPRPPLRGVRSRGGAPGGAAGAASEPAAAPPPAGAPAVAAESKRVLFSSNITKRSHTDFVGKENAAQ